MRWLATPVPERAGHPIWGMSDYCGEVEVCAETEDDARTKLVGRFGRFIERGVVDDPIVPWRLTEFVTLRPISDHSFGRIANRA